MLPSVSFGSICPLLQVFDMSTSLRFYRDGLGFEVIAVAPERAPGENYGWVWLNRGPAELMLNSQFEPEGPRPPEPDPSRRAFHGDTGLYMGCEQVDALYEELRLKGLHPQEPVDTSYGMRQLYLEDPDGYVLCFQRQI